MHACVRHTMYGYHRVVAAVLEELRHARDARLGDGVLVVYDAVGKVREELWHLLQADVRAVLRQAPTKNRVR